MTILISFSSATYTSVFVPVRELRRSPFVFEPYAKNIRVFDFLPLPFVLFLTLFRYRIFIKSFKNSNKTIPLKNNTLYYTPCLRINAYARIKIISILSCIFSLWGPSVSTLRVCARVVYTLLTSRATCVKPTDRKSYNIIDNMVIGEQLFVPSFLLQLLLFFF